MEVDDWAARRPIRELNGPIVGVSHEEPLNPFMKRHSTFPLIFISCEVFLTCAFPHAERSPMAASKPLP
jgi:hypothetical protein